MIACELLTKRFDDAVAVDGLSLEIAEGEVFGFLGPNGAGKTTTVRMLTALIAPSSGRATILGYEVGRDDTEIRRHVGLLTETPGMYDRLSARRNLEIFARLYEVEQVDRQVEKYLRLLGLWERRDDPVAEFSKGMRQKLAIGRAMLHEPQVLFLDEPTSGLDPQAARLVRDAVAQLKLAGRTIFLCTHNLDEADRLCDRVGVFNVRLLTVDTPARLRRQLFGRQVVVTLAGDAEPLVPVASSLPGVTSVTHERETLTIGIEDPERDNPALVRALVEAGAAIRYVSEANVSLEDVYLTLIRDQSSRQES